MGVPRGTKALNIAILLLDMAITVLSFVLGYGIRTALSAPMGSPLFGFSQYVWILWVFLPALYLCLRYFGFYSTRKTQPVSVLLLHLAKAFLVCTLLSATAVFMTKSDAFSRLFFLLFIGLDFVLLAVEKGVLRWFLLHVIEHNTAQVRVLVVGDRQQAEAAVQKIRDGEDWLIQVVGYAEREELDQISHLLIDHTVDEVLVVLPRQGMARLEQVLQACEELGVTVRILLDWYEGRSAKTQLHLLGGMPTLTLHTVSQREVRLLCKRGLDILGALIGLLVTGVLALFLAPIIKLDSKGPVFFKQSRVGQNGRKFWCYKFRSMYADAEERLAELQQQNEMQGAIFKIKNDPRITRVGRFLRRTSLDEFPQFWNVLKGEMSLVGTRPPTVYEVEQYDLYHRRRLSMQPGLTGLWQVSGRNDITDFEEIYQLDIAYIDHWSLGLDLKIIAKTIGVVLSGQGA